MEYIFILLIAILLLAVIFSTNKNETKQTEVDTLEKESLEIRRLLVDGKIDEAVKLAEKSINKRHENVSKFVKPECGINDTYIDFEIKGIAYRGEDSVKRTSELFMYEPLILEAESNNLQDCNAVKVITTDKIHIGYLPREIAKTVHHKLEQIKCCYVYFVKNDTQPVAYAALILEGRDNILYFDRILKDFRVRKEIEERIPELKKLSVFPEEQLQLTSQLILKYPNEFLVEYKHLIALKGCHKYDEVLEYIERMNIKWPFLLELEDISELIESTKDEKKQDEEWALYERGRAIYYDAKELYDKKEYSQALPLLIESIDLGSKFQQAPRCVCVCYEKLGQTDKIVPFCKEIIKTDWISDYSIRQLNKFIEKYS